jgi:glycosyltransferase involved in cell wall biosynthesis
VRVVFCHEFHYVRGGAERYMFELTDLLTRRDHEVIPFATHSGQNRPTPYERYFVGELDFPTLLRAGGPTNALRAAGRALYSRQARARLAALLADVRPDLIHIFGFAHYLSMSILDAATAAGVPVVQSLLDYRWRCPNTTFLSHGQVCEACRGGRYYQAVRRRCKRGSVGASLLAAAGAYLLDWTRGPRKVARFVCHSRFLMDKLATHGLPASKMRYLPHFVDLRAYPLPTDNAPLAVYFGRLSYEKGLYTLLRAAEISGMTTVIVGAGEEEAALRRAVAERGLTNVQFTGPAWGADLHAIVSRARCVVCPSEWYENSPLAVYEAMALGKPVIGAAIGGIPELVAAGGTGLLFRPGDAADLADKLALMAARPDLAQTWGAAARQVAATRFAPDAHYEELMAIYAEARRG